MEKSMNDEKIILESGSIYARRLRKRIRILFLIFLLITLLSLILNAVAANVSRDLWNEHHHDKEGSYHWYDREVADDDWDLFSNKYDLWYSIEDMTDSTIYIGLIGLGIPLLLLLVYLYCAKMKITVTNKRVYGNAAFGKRVDLPLDSISSIGTSAYKGIYVATSSGRIKFVGIENRDKIHENVSKLLIKRQNKEIIKTNETEELKRYKELLDEGIITQEDFEAKKKQLLGL